MGPILSREGHSSILSEAMMSSILPSLVACYANLTHFPDTLHGADLLCAIRLFCEIGKLMRYCSQQCQKQHWKLCHRDACSMLQQHLPASQVDELSGLDVVMAGTPDISPLTPERLGESTVDPTVALRLV